jgi:hypothetical protein
MPRPVGRPPKPLEEKIRTGNPGRRPLPERGTLTVLPGASEPPTPPRRLLAPGLAVWDRVWRNGATWIAKNIDIELLTCMCERFDERTVLRAKALGPDSEPWHWRALRALDAQITSDLIELSFTPTARARMMVAEVKLDAAVDEFFGS